MNTYASTHACTPLSPPPPPHTHTQAEVCIQNNLKYAHMKMDRVMIVYAVIEGIDQPVHPSVWTCIDMYRKICRIEKVLVRLCRLVSTSMLAYDTMTVLSFCNWARPQANKVPSNMHKMRRFRSSCDCAKYLSIQTFCSIQ